MDGDRSMNFKSLQCAVLVSVSTVSAPTVFAQSKHKVSEANGTEYRRTERTIQRPVVQTTMREHERTVYRSEQVTEVRPTKQTFYSPSTRYTWKPRTKGWWNPFSQPTVVYEPTAETVWHVKSDIVQQPVQSTRWIEEKQTVRIPERTVRMETQTVVVNEPIPASKPLAAQRRGWKQIGMKATELGEVSSSLERLSSIKQPMWR